MKNHDDEMIIKAVKWAVEASEAIYRAGGSPVGLIDRFPDALIISLVRNDLKIAYKVKEEC